MPMPEDKKRALHFDEIDSEPLVKRNNYLLAIGIDNYLHCAKLHNAVKDAKAFSKLMANRFQFEEKHIQSLFDQEATRKNIIAVFRDLVKKITPDDNLLVYFSGHGHFDELLDEGHWIPVDAKYEEEDEYLSYNKIMTIVRAIKSHHTFMIVDSCYSGSVFVGTDKSTVTERLEKDPSRWLFASGRNEVVSDGSVGENSPFAEQLLSALERYAGEGISASSLVNKVVAATTYNSNQTPIGRALQDVGDRGGEFVFRPKMDEIYDWKRTDKKGDIAAYSFFIKAYPKGKFRELACWKLAMLENTASAYDDYLEQYPNGKYKLPAMDKQVLAEEDALWERCEKAHTISEYRKYILRYPEGRYVYKAEHTLNSLKRQSEKDQEEWEEALSKNNYASYANYLKNFPKGIHARLAQEELNYIEERERKNRERKRKEEADAKRLEEERKRKQQEEARRKAALKRKEESQTPKAFTGGSEVEKPKNEPNTGDNIWGNLLSGFLSGLAQGNQGPQNTPNTPPPSTLNITGNWRGSDGFVYQLTQQGQTVYCRGTNNFGQIIAEGQGRLVGNQLTLSVRNLNGTNSSVNMMVAANARQIQGTVHNQFYGSQAMSLWR